MSIGFSSAVGFEMSKNVSNVTWKKLQRKDKNNQLPGEQNFIQLENCMSSLKVYPERPRSLNGLR